MRGPRNSSRDELTIEREFQPVENSDRIRMSEGAAINHCMIDAWFDAATLPPTAVAKDPKPPLPERKEPPSREPRRKEPPRREPERKDPERRGPPQGDPPKTPQQPPPTAA